MVAKTSKDLTFTEDGDFFFEVGRGLTESGYANNQLLIEKLILRIQSSSYDWDSFIPVTANLDDFRGAQLTSATVSNIQNQLYEAIIEDGLVRPGTVLFQSIFLTLEGVGFKITIIGDANQLPSDINLGFSYNLENNRMIAKIIGDY